MHADPIPIWIYYFAGAIAVISIAAVWLFLWRRKKQRGEESFTLGLQKTRQNFLGRLAELVSLGRDIDEQTYLKLEEILLGADVGVKSTQKLLQLMRDEVRQSGKKDISFLNAYLRQEVLKLFAERADRSAPSDAKPRVAMIVGINGAGKTTSIGKLASRYARAGQSVLLAAADTFRAGAIDQLKVWAERSGVQFLSQREGADPAAIAYDAVKSGLAKGVDRVLIDTAGRLHTKVNLMEELKKVKRVIDKAMPGAPHETLLVLDATQGQNALHQARDFYQAFGLTGIILTKLDGTAKGGIVLAIVEELGVPICEVGVGEKLEDLKVFSATEFVDALLGTDR